MAYSAPYQILETMHLRSQKIWPEWPPLHCDYFNGNDGDISLSAVEDAVKITTQYIEGTSTYF